MRKIIPFFLIFLVTAPAALMADTVTFTGSGSGLAGSAEFTVNGDNLKVVLANIYPGDLLVPSEVLTALFWGMPGSVTLTPVSAVVTAGSAVLFGTTDPGGVVGGEWAYRSGPYGAGIGSAGLGIFGPSNLFPGTNLQGPISPDGVQYGLAPAGDNPATGNSAVTGSNALIKYSATFTLSGATGLNPLEIEDVWFQFGTDPCEPHFPGEPVPVPPTVWLFASGLLGLGLMRRRLCWGRPK